MWINKSIYVAVLIYSGVLALLYMGVQCMYIFFMLLIFGVLQIGLVWYSKRHLKATLKVDSATVNKDEPMQVSLVIENTSFLPVACVKAVISYENEYEHLKQYQSFCVSINGMTTQSIKFTLTSEHVGSMKVGIKKVVVYDLLRIFHRNLKPDTSCTIKVFPEVFSMENEIKVIHQELLDSETFSKVKSGDDPSEVFDIREYKDGDKIHRIHWKLSSKRDCVMVKEYSLPIACSVGILVNLSVDKKEEHRLSYYDAMMATIASMSYHMIANEQVHFIAWYEKKKEDYHCERITGEEDLYRVLYELLEVKAEETGREIVSMHSMLGTECSVAKLYYVTGEEMTDEEETFSTDYSKTEVQAIRIVGEKEPWEETGVAFSGGIEYIEVDGYKERIEALLL